MSDEKHLKLVDVPSEPEPDPVVVATTLNVPSGTPPFITEAMMKKYVNDAILKQNRDLQEALDKYAHQHLQIQMDFNQKWNAINAIVRVCYKQGLITNELLEQAGYELMFEAKQNMEYVISVQKDKTKLYDASKIKNTSLDDAQKAIEPAKGKTVGELRRIVESYKDGKEPA